MRQTHGRFSLVFVGAEPARLFALGLGCENEESCSAASPRRKLKRRWLVTTGARLGRGVEGATMRRFPADDFGCRRGEAAGEPAP
jgi:hypothetical protein